jgi:Na+-transporting methylmalonyl-CoA/oxaloacetate decarboxylase gamma subunit
MVDWGLAIRTGAVGFGLVFVVLVVLALAVWTAGLLVRKYLPARPEAKGGKKG